MLFVYSCDEFEPELVVFILIQTDITRTLNNLPLLVSKFLVKLFFYFLPFGLELILFTKHLHSFSDVYDYRSLVLHPERLWLLLIRRSLRPLERKKVDLLLFVVWYQYLRGFNLSEMTFYFQLLSFLLLTDFL